ncbi:RNA polymerase sigma factor [Streptomyces sp. NPDC058155]|uniref:RNA polymerase sigma factor n=1 Tax=Streptomyces sp. NPDC058155 TaxID=3346359 RepID=UPI0036E10361
MAEPEAVTAEALGEVFTQYRGEMTGKARNLLRDANVPPSVADADDIVSTAFTTALRDPGAVQQPRAYLYKLIRTQVIHVSTRCAEHQRLDEKRAADPLCRPSPVVADFSALVDNRDAVHRAVQCLSLPQRTAVWMTHALDYTRDETAVLMGKHPGTVARHTTRAMVFLRAGIAAVFIGILTLIGLTVGREVQRTTPTSSPREYPSLPSTLWWSDFWMDSPVPALFVVGAAWATMRRNRQRKRQRPRTSSTLRRNGTRARSSLPNAAMLCSTCHQRASAGKLSQREQNAVLLPADFTRQAASACQLCGHEGSLAAPLEVAHIFYFQDQAVFTYPVGRRFDKWVEERIVGGTDQ